MKFLKRRNENVRPLLYVHLFEKKTAYYLVNYVVHFHFHSSRNFKTQFAWKTQTLVKFKTLNSARSYVYL